MLVSGIFARTPNRAVAAFPRFGRDMHTLGTGTRLLKFGRVRFTHRVPCVGISFVADGLIVGVVEFMRKHGSFGFCCGRKIPTAIRTLSRALLIFRGGENADVLRIKLGLSCLEALIAIASLEAKDFELVFSRVRATASLVTNRTYIPLAGAVTHISGGFLVANAVHFKAVAGITIGLASRWVDVFLGLYGSRLWVIDAFDDTVIPVLATLIALGGLEIGRHEAVIVGATVWTRGFFRSLLRSSCQFFSCFARLAIAIFYAITFAVTLCESFELHAVHPVQRIWTQLWCIHRLLDVATLDHLFQLGLVQCGVLLTVTVLENNLHFPVWVEDKVSSLCRPALEWLTVTADEHLRGSCDTRSLGGLSL